MSVNALALSADPLALSVNALALSVNALALSADPLALQGIAKYNLLRILGGGVVIVPFLAVVCGVDIHYTILW
ncbi:MAG: hypothetical protein HWQ41_25555 [Nostoc sp. NOS(2021)]|uniref:hypothetical protein n=1 Tax=Nostoc sp. NOS(2021) TaxID=2815407 RepID=UPI0025FA1617|nr:hypothetical protein [Nostoc sp. NOS(2021)]MBN3898509.1 hypothetical protein [Nostoc sp. NOS(2021)]